MLRLDQLYFRNFSILFFATLLVTAVSGYFLLERIEINNYKTMLTNMIDEYAVTEKHVADLDAWVHAIRKKTGVRVTIIDRTGRVLYESNRKTEGMENHLERPEIREARQQGIGYAIRHSVSVDKDFLYVAKKEGDHYVRMAYTLDNIHENFFSFWIKAMLLFAGAMALAFWMAMKINRRISQDLEHIEINLENMLNKNYETRFDQVSCCKEFDTISKQIVKVSKKLEKRERQKAKYTKNLKLLSKKQSDIISAISHEFKNPVAAIVGYTQTIHEDEDLSPEIRRKFLEKVLNNAQKISSMIDRLALAIKLENETFKPVFSDFRIVSVLEEVRDNLQHKYPNREIVIDADEALKLRGDRAMFENLMTNLVENGLKYSEEEVVVRVRDARVEVIDKGIGISEADIGQITKRFFRVDALSWDNSIGVGLYIVKYILKLHNTFLEIESRPNKGSKFWFDIKEMIVS
ncbi:MAG TPA: sensor histidine kinase [Campylobacteraceae bacterium]|nr:sensor histidine kinase [Campylobacteraceae bacterium]